jgi:hypothetical protein
MKATGNTVQNAGLYLFPCGYLGSTPDGIITSTSSELPGKGVLEVKCPWKHRNATINEMVQAELNDKESKKGFYLTKTLSLNNQHNYWHQVQAEMAATKTIWAHFVIWTTKDLKIILVKKNQEWMEQNLPKLKYFYLNELMPYIYRKEE